MTGSRVLFRTGGSAFRGLGHVRRCLSLADALRHRGVSSIFRVHGGGALVDFVEAHGFEAAPAMGVDIKDAHRTRDLADALTAGMILADSYDFEAGYLAQLRPAAGSVAAIDDLNSGPFAVDLVINGALGAERWTYRGGTGTRFLLGAGYALLRPEFAEVPPDHRRQTGRVFVTTGGSDPHELTHRLTRWALAAGAHQVDAVIGPLVPTAEIDRTRAAGGDTVTVHRDPADIRGLMLAADVAISGGGQTLYELAATATPVVAVRTADNQRANIEALSAAGAILPAGAVDEPHVDVRVQALLQELLDDADRRSGLGLAGRQAVDGGGADRVAEVIGKILEGGRC
jgi:UDP-2,4-diacetamido-2,4,6-trideoxy-beta-L-altropyranose hydrolase